MDDLNLWTSMLYQVNYLHKFPWITQCDSSTQCRHRMSKFSYISVHPQKSARYGTKELGLLAHKTLNYLERGNKLAADISVDHPFISRHYC